MTVAPTVPREPRPHPLVIAHRGASGYRPEHTAAAYRLAIALGADAVEPDLVPTRDGVLVIRHENEISGTTDVAERPEFADRRTTKTIDGVAQTGWFTEDFTWAELSTLRARERLPRVRPASASFDDRAPILRLEDLLALLRAAPRPVGLVAEVKHAAYFASIGLPLDGLVAEGLAGWDGELWIESFERTVLDELAALGVRGRRVYLLDDEGSPADLVARLGSAAPSYRSQLEPAALAALAPGLDGISVARSLLLDPEGRPDPRLVERAHALGLEIFVWTLRPENPFLHPSRRRGAKRAWGDWITDLGAVLATGVDGAFFDHPDLGLALRDGI